MQVYFSLLIPSLQYSTSILVQVALMFSLCTYVAPTWTCLHGHVTTPYMVNKVLRKHAKLNFCVQQVSNMEWLHGLHM